MIALNHMSEPPKPDPPQPHVVDAALVLYKLDLLSQAINSALDPLRTMLAGVETSEDSDQTATAARTLQQCRDDRDALVTIGAYVQGTISEVERAKIPTTSQVAQPATADEQPDADPVPSNAKYVAGVQERITALDKTLAAAKASLAAGEEQVPQSLLIQHLECWRADVAFLQGVPRPISPEDQAPPTSGNGKPETNGTVRADVAAGDGTRTEALEFCFTGIIADRLTGDLVGVSEEASQIGTFVAGLRAQAAAGQTTVPRTRFADYVESMADLLLVVGNRLEAHLVLINNFHTGDAPGDTTKPAITRRSIESVLVRTSSVLNRLVDRIKFIESELGSLKKRREGGEETLPVSTCVELLDAIQSDDCQDLLALHEALASVGR